MGTCVAGFVDVFVAFRATVQLKVIHSCRPFRFDIESGNITHILFEGTNELVTDVVRAFGAPLNEAHLVEKPLLIVHCCRHKTECQHSLPAIIPS